jgi:hypothetical protein
VFGVCSNLADVTQFARSIGDIGDIGDIADVAESIRLFLSQKTGVSVSTFSASGSIRFSSLILLGEAG